MKHYVENPKNLKHDYQTYHLESGDSLTFQFSGVFRQVKDRFEMKIKGYDRAYAIDKTSCDNLTIDFGGMWLPGGFNPADAMEGYNFRKKIFVKPDTTQVDKRKEKSL